MRPKSFDRVLLILTVGLLSVSACNGGYDPRQDVATIHKLWSVEIQKVIEENAETRGNFTPEACADDGQQGSRMDVPPNAVTAVYLDEAGQAVGVFAEDLTGTENRRMCPTPPAGGPGGCSPKPPWCSVQIAGATMCVKKTPC